MDKTYHYKIGINFTPKGSEEKLPGYLTNWNENNCFIYIENIGYKNFKDGLLEVSFNNNKYQMNCNVNTVFENGLGVNFSRSKKSWKNLINILIDLGYKPNNLAEI